MVIFKRIILLLLLINFYPIQVDAEYSRFDKERKCLGLNTIEENVVVSEEECEQILKMSENENKEVEYHDADLDKDGTVTSVERKEYTELITPADKENITLSLSTSVIITIIFICFTAIVITLIRYKDKKSKNEK